MENPGDEPPGTRRNELDHLLQRIATHIADADKAAGGQGPAPEETPSEAPEAAQPQRASLGLRRVRDSEPPALRSAVASTPASVNLSKLAQRLDGLADGGHELDPGTAGTGPAAAGTEGAGTEGWDKASAEALTRTFEEDAAVPPLRSMLNIMAQPAAGAHGGGHGRPGQMAFGGAGEGDVGGGQTRLFEAAQRVEAMLDRLAPKEAIDSLGFRFEALEHEVRSSTEKITRLDGIEHRLEELSNKLTDDSMVALFGPLVPTADDLTHFAEDAAGRAAERVLEAYAREISPAAGDPGGAPHAAHGDVKSLGELVASFMDERRRSDASTLEALETLQLAMQHILDRMDQAGEPETLAATVAHPTAEASGGNRFVPPVPASGGRVDDHEHARSEDDIPSGAVNLTANQDLSSLTADTYRMPAKGLREAAPFNEPAAPIESYSRHTGEQVEPSFTSAPMDAEAYAPPSLEGPNLDAPRANVADRQDGQPAADAPPMTDRQAMIARARKAAERAGANADGQKAQTDKPAKAKDAGAKKGSLFSSGVVRPGVLLVAIAAIAFAAYWLVLGHKARSPMTSGSAVVEQAAPSAETVSGNQPDLAPESSAAKADRGAAGADQMAPSKMSNEARPSSFAEPLQEASAVPAAEDVTGPGMAIAFGESPSTVDAVVQARERSRIASLSQRAAFSAVRSHGTNDTGAFADLAAPSHPRQAPEPAPARSQAAYQSAKTSAIETSSVPQHVETQQGAAMRQHLALPPATSGPLSLRMAAAQGDAGAQLEIATRLAEGKGVRQNFAEAAKWYERAAAQGQPIAEYRLATLYERGMGVRADRNKAKLLYQSAAQKGNLKAMHNLAVISASPVSGSPDYVTAARLFERAARHGLHDSQYNLGVLYESGLGVPKDHAAAYKWYKLAAAGGDADAARRRDMLISRLPPETLQAIEAQTAVWRPEQADERANNARVVGSTWAQR